MSLDKIKKLLAIPSQGEVYGLRDELAWFANKMESVLRCNDHKRHWTGMSTAQLLTRLRQELRELERETKRDGTLDGGTWKIIKEAADVANFAMMIADVEYKKQQERWEIVGIGKAVEAKRAKEGKL